MRQERLERGDRDRLVSAFLLKHVKQHGGGRPALRMAIKVHYVIEVAWPRPLSERPQFFAERFFVCVAICPYASLDLAPDRRKHQSFIRCQVELDFGPAA